MPIIFIPAVMKELTAGAAEIRVGGSTVREAVAELEATYPGIRDWLFEDNRLKPNIAVAVDGVVSPIGLLQHVGENSEIHFVAAISGG